MLRKLFFVFIFIFSVSHMTFAGHYISDNKRTYIGETNLYYCYIYNFDVNMVIKLTDFYSSGNWAATVALEPKTDDLRRKFISRLKDAVYNSDTNTIVMPVRENKFWAFSTRLVYDKQQDKLFVKDNMCLNEYGEIISISRTHYLEFKREIEVETWAIKDLADKHIHKRYQEEYERRNTIVR